jgi:hypothetical protein
MPWAQWAPRPAPTNETFGGAGSCKTDYETSGVNRSLRRSAVATPVVVTRYPFLYQPKLEISVVRGWRFNAGDNLSVHGLDRVSRGFSGWSPFRTSGRYLLPDAASPIKPFDLKLQEQVQIYEPLPLCGGSSIWS